MGRILTIQIEIIDQKKAAWIWDTHMNNEHFHGVFITAIQEGPIYKTNEDEDANN